MTSIVDFCTMVVLDVAGAGPDGWGFTPDPDRCAGLPLAARPTAWCLRSPLGPLRGAKNSTPEIRTLDLGQKRSGVEAP
ncbi:hypothetical protein C8R47DRAFT_1224337 [Mycena vitilis]|nr:hypothetical protein C8R47DRAFT_1224337 [Mycena vitilis]